jgi:hypothetical protein
LPDDARRHLDAASLLCGPADTGSRCALPPSSEGSPPTSQLRRRRFRWSGGSQRRAARSR